MSPSERASAEAAGRRPPRKPRDQRRARAGLGRPERMLPYTCLAAAIVLGASELATTFRLTAAANAPLCVQHGIDRHHFALLLLAVFAGFTTITAVVAGSRPAARATAAAGVIALFLFFVIDLPHANNVGSISSACDLEAGGGLITAKAVPQGGFWLELIGALALSVSGIALATLTSRQLHALRPRWLVGSGTEPKDEPKRPLLRPAGREAEAEANPGPKEQAKRRERPKRERAKRERPKLRRPKLGQAKRERTKPERSKRDRRTPKRTDDADGD